MRDSLLEKAGRLDNLLKEVAKLLAVNTNYASMVSGPTYRSRKVKFLQITEVDEAHILLVMVLEGNLVRNKMLLVREPVDKETILKLNIMLNTFLQGLDLTEINMQMISRMKEQAGAHSPVISDILDACLLYTSRCV